MQATMENKMTAINNPRNTQSKTSDDMRSLLFFEPEDARTAEDLLELEDLREPLTLSCLPFSISAISATTDTTNELMPRATAVIVLLKT